jgi:lysophospholipase L1-like esterase
MVRPTTARALDAEWQLTSVSGIGLIHSCCNMSVTIPQVFDKVFLVKDSINWNFSNYTPDVVTICIGQNDGKQDSVTFCSTYVNFIKDIRGKYPKANIVCLTSPMGNAELTGMLKRYITAVQQYFNDNGDDKVSHYFFSRSFNDGCGAHPSMAQHALIAAELTAYLKQLKSW